MSRKYLFVVAVLALLIGVVSMSNVAGGHLIQSGFILIGIRMRMGLKMIGEMWRKRTTIMM